MNQGQTIPIIRHDIDYDNSLLLCRLTILKTETGIITQKAHSTLHYFQWHRGFSSTYLWNASVWKPRLNPFGLYWYWYSSPWYWCFSLFCLSLNDLDYRAVQWQMFEESFWQREKSRAFYYLRHYFFGHEMQWKANVNGLSPKVFSPLITEYMHRKILLRATATTMTIQYVYSFPFPITQKIWHARIE